MAWLVRLSPTMTPQELRNRSMQFAVRAVRFCRTLPDSWEARRIGGQLIDASTSMAMNYRAAERGRSYREFIAKLGMVVEEADETLGWIELISRCSWQAVPEQICLLGEAKELVAIFGSSYHTARERQREQRSKNGRPGDSKNQRSCGLKNRRSGDAKNRRSGDG
jgi:four helix bundle protein